MQAMAAAPRCPSLLVLMPLLLLSCCAAADEKLIHLHFYFNEVRGNPNATAAVVAGQHNGSPAAFGDVNVYDNVLREGADPASRLIGRVQGFSMNSSVDGAGTFFSAFSIVFSGDYAEYGGSSLAAQGMYHLDLAGGPSERSIVGGTGKLRFARGYMTSQLVANYSNTTFVGVYDVYFTLPN